MYVIFFLQLTISQSPDSPSESEKLKQLDTAHTNTINLNQASLFSYYYLSAPSHLPSSQSNQSNPIPDPSIPLSKTSSKLQLSRQNLQNLPNVQNRMWRFACCDGTIGLISHYPSLPSAPSAPSSLSSLSPSLSQNHAQNDEKTMKEISCRIQFGCRLMQVYCNNQTFLKHFKFIYIYIIILITLITPGSAAALPAESVRAEVRELEGHVRRVGRAAVLMLAGLLVGLLIGLSGLTEVIDTHRHTRHT